MKEEILKIIEKYSGISYDEGIKIIGESEFENLAIEIDKLLSFDETELERLNLELNHFDYGIWQLKQDGEILMEGEKADCIKMVKRLND